MFLLYIKALDGQRQLTTVYSADPEQDIIYPLRAVMRDLYYALIYPYLSYGNIPRGNTYTTRLQPIRRLQKKIIRIITFSKYTDHSPLFKELAILPLNDINSETTAFFMIRFFNSMLPSSFNDYFRLNKGVHKYNTRLSSKIQKTQTRINYQKLGEIQRKFNME